MKIVCCALCLLILVGCASSSGRTVATGPDTQSTLEPLLSRYQECRHNSLWMKAGIPENMIPFFIAVDVEPKVPPTLTPAQSELKETINQCRALLAQIVVTLKASSQMPLDVNKDGAINSDDVSLLAKQFTQHFERNVKPLIAKAGIQIDEKGHIDSADARRLRERLAAGEQDHLSKTLREANLLATLVDAAIWETLRKK